MSAAQEARGAGLGLLTSPAPGGSRALSSRLASSLGPSGWPVAVYSGSRLLLLAVAGLVSLAGHRPFTDEFFNFDGQWYLRLMMHGYPSHALRTQSTLGFLPLYPLVVRIVAWGIASSVRVAALVTSAAGGLAATLLVQRLATSWWGEETGNRATVIFSLFPGTVVFSMAYSECLTVPLALGCLLELRRRRWWTAGALAGLATAVEPIALVLVLACLGAAVAQIRRQGWRDPAARRSLAAPLLAPAGLACVGVFLWVWTGTPFATYLAQHYGWHQQNEPLALLALPIAGHLLHTPGELLSYLFSWNIWNGLLGGVFLACSIVALVRVRREIGTGALVLTAGVAAVTLWSVLTPPNARMVLVAFPAVIVWARRLAGRKLVLFLAVEALVFVAASALTFSGLMLP